MKSLIKPMLAAVGIVVLSAGSATAQQDTERAKISTLLRAYETALNTADTGAVIALYTADAVFMPQYSPPQVGADAVRGAYERVFAAITLDIAFAIIEIRPVAPDWAFARTTSTGSVTINASGEKGPEANQELFILNKNSDGAWKIARYIFATTLPRRR